MRRIFFNKFKPIMKIIKELLIILIALLLSMVLELFLTLPLLHPCKDMLFNSLCAITFQSVLPEFLLEFMSIYLVLRYLFKKLKK